MNGRFQHFTCKFFAGTTLFHGNVNVWPRYHAREKHRLDLREAESERGRVCVYLLEYKLFSFPAGGRPTKRFSSAAYRWISLDYAYRISDRERTAVGLNGGESFLRFASAFLANAKIAAIFPVSVTFKLKRALSAEWISREYNPAVPKARVWQYKASKILRLEWRAREVDCKKFKVPRDQSSLQYV